MAKVEYRLPTKKVLDRNASQSLVVAQKFKITNKAEYGAALVEHKALKERKTKLTNQRLGITEPLNFAKEGVMDLFREPVNMLDRAEKALAVIISKYEQKQSEAEKRRQDVADEKARKRRETLIKRSKVARKAGKIERAERLMEEAEAIAVQRTAQTTAKSGIHKREAYDVTITNKDRFIKAYLAGKLPVDFVKITIVEPRLKAVALSRHGKVKWPGVKIVRNDKVISRS